MQLSRKLPGVFLLFALFTMSSFGMVTPTDETPEPITQRLKTNEIGEQLLQTTIVIDGRTNREDLIHACTFLATDEVQLTFERLTIRKAFLGVLGKKRIAQAKGKIALPNGSVESFKAGGAVSFRSITIVYSKNLTTDRYFTELVEIIH